LQAGAGGIALAFVDYLRRMMKEDGVKARFVRGGSTKYLLELLQEGLTDYILDGQTFDLDGVKSIASDPRHVVTRPSPLTTTAEKTTLLRWWRGPPRSMSISMPT
jgi:citrate lyase subunit alpha / citrate CoA-transferase